MISQQYPNLAMQGIVADARYSVVPGQTLRIPVPPDTLGILAYNRAAGLCQPLPIPADGQFQWTAPNPGSSEIVFVRHVFRSSPTRYTNRADGTGDKDSLYSLIDYLNPEATRAYLKLIHETYQKIVGDEFGQTILGFRGDEPDYTGFMPWTPKLLETFQRIKGYDLQPYLAQFFEPEFIPEVMRAKADYWDVWSAMFRDAFFKPQADWCEARGMGYMVHLNHEELMLDMNHPEDMIHNEGSFFRDMRYVDAPGVDNLNQIGPGIVADFPKLATSAAHLSGHPQVWEEEGGSPGQTGKFIADYNFVRGMNFLNIRGMNSPPDASAHPLLNSASTMAWYINRASYLLATGRPGAQVALYHPTDSMWLGDKEADDVTVKLVTQLMEHQVDFDHVDLDGLLSECTLEGGTLKNLSGQAYKAVIVPTSTVIDRRMLDRLRAFAAAGGKVIFVGRTPSLVVDRTFLHPESGAPDLSFATLEPQPDITSRVLAALPAPDVALDTPCPPLKYIRRNLQDGDVYFFFNESAETQSRTVTLAGTGTVQVWDANKGTIAPLAGAGPAQGSVSVPLTLGPQETRFIVIGPLPVGAGAPFPSVSAAEILTKLDGEWSVALGEKRLTVPLQSWRDLGAAGFTGTAAYAQDFTAPAALPPGKRIYLDLGNVHEIAQIRLNGQDLEAKAWPPYVWDVTSLVKPGANSLEVRVELPSLGAQRGFGGGGGGGGAGGLGRRGETLPVDPNSRPKGISPTGVPGGLGDAADPFGGRAPRGTAFAPGVPRLGGGAPAQTANAGLLGPVRLLAE